MHANAETGLRFAAHAGRPRTHSGAPWGALSTGTDRTELPVVHQWGSFVAPELPRRRSDVHEYAIDGELLLLDPTTQTLFHLNSTAASLWHMCDGRPLRDAVRLLASAHDEEFDTVMEHVNAVIDVLAIGGLLAPSAAGVGHV